MRGYISIFLFKYINKMRRVCKFVLQRTFDMGKSGTKCIGGYNPPESSSVKPLPNQVAKYLNNPLGLHKDEPLGTIITMNDRADICHGFAKLISKVFGNLPVNLLFLRIVEGHVISLSV